MPQYFMQYPPLPNATTKALIEASGITETGNLMDDFRTALVSILGLADSNAYTLDDLWKRFIIAQVPSDANAESGNPATAGRGHLGHVGQSPGLYYSQAVRRDSTKGFPATTTLGNPSTYSLKAVGDWTTVVTGDSAKSIPLPSGYEAGDILMMQGGTYTGSLHPTFTGSWSNGSGTSLSVFWRVATGDANDEATSPSFATLGTNGPGLWRIVAFHNPDSHNTATNNAAGAGFGNGSGTTDAILEDGPAGTGPHFIVANSIYRTSSPVDEATADGFTWTTYEHMDDPAVVGYCYDATTAKTVIALIGYYFSLDPDTDSPADETLEVGWLSASLGRVGATRGCKLTTV